MPKFTSDQARQLSQWFHDLSTAVGDYRFTNWSSLSPTQRSTLESEQWSLLNASSDMTTKAVDIELEESEKALSQLRSATSQAAKALKRLSDIRKVLALVSASVALAAAVLTMDPGAILKAAKGVINASKKDKASVPA